LIETRLSDDFSVSKAELKLFFGARTRTRKVLTQRRQAGTSIDDEYEQEQLTKFELIENGKGIKDLKRYILDDSVLCSLAKPTSNS